MPKFQIGALWPEVFTPFVFFPQNLFALFCNLFRTTCCISCGEAACKQKSFDCPTLFPKWLLCCSPTLFLHILTYQQNQDISSI